MNKKLSKRILAMILSFAVVFSMIPGAVFADENAPSTQLSGITVVNNASELAALGGKDVKGTIELAADIDMAGTVMEPIKSLTGTLEGNGYTISNLNISGEAGIAYKDPNVGLGLIAQLSGSVQNLQITDISITSNSKSKIYAGTIAGIIESAEAEINNCSVQGDITLPKNSTNAGTGGVAGGALLGSTLSIANVYSNVDIINGKYAGGLIGIVQYANNIEISNSVVMGDLEVSTGGGIIGWLNNVSVTADKAYFGGTITGSKKYGFAYTGNYYNGEITANYVYYDSDKNKGTYFEALTDEKGLNGTISGKSTAELKELGFEGFAKNTEGYPVPKWLTNLGGERTVKVTATVADSVTLTKGGGDPVTMTGSNGVFTAKLAEGSYTYTATSGAADKDNATGILIVGKTDKETTITLPNKVADTVIKVTPANAELKVYKGANAEGELMSAKAVAKGEYTYALKEGSYYYVANADEYQTMAGSFTVPADDSRVVISLEALPKYQVSFNIDCGNKAPEIRVFKDQKEYTQTEGKYSLTAGKYSYEITAEDCIPETGEFEVSDKALTVSVELKAVTGNGTAEAPYIISDKAELAYFAQQVNDGVKKYAEGHVQLSNDIDLDNTSWTPIGSNRTAPFKGHFDGKGYTVSGLNVNNARTYYGFLGCLDNATVENLTLKGQVYCSEPYARVGGLAGYAVGDITIKNCGSAVNVSALARGCEGVGGLVGGYEDGIEYKWEDHKMLIEESYNAGNIVCTGSDSNVTIGGLVGGNKNCVQLENCYNTGAVYGPGVQAAGLIGNAGAQTGDNCRPSLKGCYNAGNIVGAEGKEFGLYAKGTIAAANVQDCYVEKDTASGVNNGANVVSDEVSRKEMLKKLGDKWALSEDKNNGLPYIKGIEPVAADTSLVDELSKYLDTISVSSTTEINSELRTLKADKTADSSITAEFVQSEEDIHSGYINAAGSSIKLNKKNETGAAVTETATLKLSKNGIMLSKPVSIVIYPAGENLATLIDTIAGNYVDKSDEWVVFDMAAYAALGNKTHKTSEAAKQNYLNLTINALEQSSATASDRAKGEIILSALNIDTTKLTPYESSQEYSNAAKLKAMSGNVAYYTAPWILLADEQGNTQLTSAQIQQLVKIITDSQGQNGICQGTYWGKKYDDIDTTGTALAALARFAKATEDTYGVQAAATDFITKAVAGLAKAQNENGSFGNVNTDAMVIIGLAAIGNNPNSFAKNGSSLADALTLYINDSQSGFTAGYADGATGEKAQALATEQGFRALIVLEKIKQNPNSGYNIYTGKSYAGITTPVPTPGTDKEAGGATGEGKTDVTPSTPGSGETSSKNILARLTIAPDSSNEWITTTSYTLAEGSTAYDLITKALSAAGMSCTGADNNYITAVSKGGNTLANLDKGPNSGWLYSVNGKLPDVGIKDYTLKNGDSVKLYYVEDWTKDSQAGAWTETKKEVITTGTDVKITTVPTEVKVSGSTATATVTDENAAELVKQAKENKSAEIVLNVSSSDTDKAETVNLELTKKTLNSIVNDTDATVTVKTQTGEINLDKETLKQINSEAAGDVITIEITRISKPEETHKALIGADGQIYRLTVKSGDSVISQFKGNVTVRLAIPAALKDRAIAAVHIKDGVLEKLDGRRITQDKVEFYEFKTPHFSEFALVDTDQVKLEADDDNADKAKSLVKELKLTAASSKTSKKNVKITVKMNSKNNALINELKGMGYTVKYKYYRSTKKTSKYKALKTKTAKTYINTKGKKGSRYYYKVRVMVYDGDKLVAQSALKQCKYAARVWSK